MQRRFTVRAGLKLRMGVVLGTVLLGAAFVGAIEHGIPILGPGLAPRHGAAAHRAQLTWQKLFVAFEFVFHGVDVPDQVNKSSCCDGWGVVFGADLVARLAGALRREPDGGRPLLREPCRSCTSCASSRARFDLRKPYIRSLAALVAALSSTMGAG